ncbi:MAG: fluoride efflux transporter CrcB [Planctomycetota bacterium]|jgi:CrcB protein|nr:fluoride efflux transporter CrcB [Planctomycetota bacterium]
MLSIDTGKMEAMLKILVVGLGGFLGAVLRYGISRGIHRVSENAFPYGTLIVNLLGCFTIGLLISMVQDRAALDSPTRLFLVVGLLGSFTTFSTLGYETIGLIEKNFLSQAFLSIGGNLILGLGAVFLGQFISRVLSA